MLPLHPFCRAASDKLHATGSPSLDFERAMRSEHCSLGGHSFEFTTRNYQVTTKPHLEWLYVVGDDRGQRRPCPDMGHGRRLVPVEQLMERPLAKRAKLTRAEMIAVVLYTGPMFVVYNGILRQYPKELHAVFAESDNRFSTTIFVLVSAVQKLSRCMSIPAGMMLYRGLGGTLQLPDSFTNADENGCKGYCEFGFMSTTADRNVAVQYSGVRDKKPQASIMEIRPNAVDRGADISEFSQYPGEREFLFVPMSYVQGQERCRVEVGAGGGVLKVISVSVNINLKTETLEQLTGKKKSMHISAFKSVIDETKQWMQAYAEEDGRLQARAATDKEYEEGGFDISEFISCTIEQMQEIKDADSALPDSSYVDDLKYKALVARMLSSQEWAKQKLKLWLENEETMITDIYCCELKSVHRQWLTFLKQRQHSVAVAGSDQRKQAATKILQCKGLMVTDDALTEEADGEPLIYAAVADGWALDDLQA
jgi:5-hydroxyisourate hydrolase-like protein (transthyretin family)